MAGEENRELDKEGAKETSKETPKETGVASAIAGAAAGEGRFASETDEDEDEAGPVPDEGRVPPEMGPLEEPVEHTKASTLNRVIARIIDILFALLLSRLPDYIGFFAGITYIGIADGLMGGRSLGKRVIGLRVHYAKGGRNGDFRASILRNSPIGLLYALYYIPFVGWALACLGLGFELLLVIGSPEGKRLGDEIAATVVVDEIGDNDKLAAQ